MEIRPSLEEVLELAGEDRYGSIPISGEILSDVRTPIEVLRILKGVSDHCYMLESASEHQTWGRYSFLGYDPGLEVTCRNGHFKAGSFETDTDDPGEYIRKIIAEHKSPVFDYLPPFTGGLVGYFSYDYLKYAEPTLSLDAPDTEGFKDLDLMLFDKVIAFDNYRQKIVLIVNIPTSDPEAGYKKACDEIRKMRALIEEGTPVHDKPGVMTGPVTALFGEEEFCSMVEKGKKHIYEGDIFQIVLSNRLEAPFEGSLLGTYRILRTVNPSPYMFYLASEDLEVAGASPETLVKLEDGVLHTFPLAGTRPRGKSPAEDEALEAELLKDPKELAEHSMLVDLGRNDLGKISRFGSVEVEKAFQVLRYSHVMHIGSTVRSEIAPDKETRWQPCCRQELSRELPRSWQPS